MKRLVLPGLSLLVVVLGYHQAVNGRVIAPDEGRADASAKPVEVAELRAASANALKLMQRAQGEWYKHETCTSCHHQLLPEMPLRLARERGIPFDETAARDATTAAFAFLKDLDTSVQGYDYVDVTYNGWLLASAHTAGIPPNSSTTAYARFIASRQLSNGSWFTTDERPPQVMSLFTSTAVCAMALKEYLPERLKAEKENRLQRARTWLLQTTPRTTEDRAFQLFGLYWTGADWKVRQAAARRLVADQREDGGWSQLPGMASDAYSTGEVLVALHEGGELATSDPVYQRGLRFLLRTQEADGCWHVRSRLHPPAPVSPPYFDTGFPYEHDQFISMMGTTWAATAMLHAIPARADGAPAPRALADFAPTERAEWIDVALVGSAADLERLLDHGLKPDAKTAGGTTALMLAAQDLEKVKLLVERGADVNARATSGLTALIVASRYNGNADVVRLLLKKGACADAGKEGEVRYNASPLFLAAASGDVRMAELLLGAGAAVDTRMLLLGRAPVSPLFIATLDGDVAMTDLLLAKGANPNETDGDGISVLGWATIANRVDLVRLLLARGADVNHVDNYGMTPLLYATSIDYGETSTLELLLGAGADVKAQNKQGLTALDVAKSYSYSAMASVLARNTKSR
jgi:ankyrin repeat protein